MTIDIGGLSSVSMHYRDANAGPYPFPPGHSEQTGGDSAVNAQIGSLDRRTISQQGDGLHVAGERVQRHGEAADGHAFEQPRPQPANRAGFTTGYGYKGALTKIEDAATSFRDVLAKDIRDVRAIVGSKYNEGLKEVTKYYKENFPDLINK